MAALKATLAPRIDLPDLTEISNHSRHALARFGNPA
jgi:hypothetical protein